MRVCQSLICCLFLTLQDRNSVVDAETNIFTKTEGEDITVRCNFTFSGSTRLLCKDTCERGSILINTHKDRVRRGRYSIKYEYRLFGLSILDVTISNLRKSDSGWYKCELQQDWGPDSEDNFKIIVTEASVTSAPDRTVEPSPTTPISSVVITTTTKGLNSTTSSHLTTNQNTRSVVLLYVGLTLVGLIVMFLGALLIFCSSQRFKQKKEPPSEMQYANIPLHNHVYEEIREKSIVYPNINYKGQRSDSIHLYSLIDFPQNKAEDHSINYSLIQFPDSAPSSSAPCGHIENEIYSSV